MKTKLQKNVFYNVFYNVVLKTHHYTVVSLSRNIDNTVKKYQQHTRFIRRFTYILQNISRISFIGLLPHVHPNSTHVGINKLILSFYY